MKWRRKHANVLVCLQDPTRIILANNICSLHTCIDREMDSRFFPTGKFILIIVILEIRLICASFGVQANSTAKTIY